MNDDVRAETAQEQLSRLFGSFKAEWLREQMYDLFTEPSYFPEVTSPRPCVLLGGRGTGKTTVLRCMSYGGRFALEGSTVEDIPNWPYYGFYLRVNTNRVTAFQGPELTEDRWIRTFAHYINLVLCNTVLRFLQWYQLHCRGSNQLDGTDCATIAASLNLPDVRSVRDLSVGVRDALVAFEAYLNNVADGPRPRLSLQGAPVDALFDAILRLPQFRGKNFFFLIDEYENFLDYQQRVVNTLIKHSGELYTFKIGVRELGLRCRTTLNENEQLISPADYVRIHIEEKLSGERFVEFALQVCNDRIKRLQISQDPIPDLKWFLPCLSEEDEAELLDDRRERLGRAASQLSEIASREQAPLLEELTPLEKYFLSFWAHDKDIPLEEVWRDFCESRDRHKTRYRNYKHALLYTLRPGKRGIRKYYAGWHVFTQLAACNIRYFLELVVQSLMLNLQTTETLKQPVSPRIQTVAAQQVGRKNLSELEGLSVHGGNLTKLLLGLGRVFQTMASQACGHAPEVNQFHLVDGAHCGSGTDLPSEQSKEVAHLLTSAVMHLALLRSPGSKLADETDTKDYDYMIHPIFSPFFVFSYRRKRKMALRADQVLGLIRQPKKTIREILAAQHRAYDEAFPEQLLIFKGYYDADS